MARNPTWTRDELILACDLVRENNWRRLMEDDKRVHELSALLRRASFHPAAARDAKFRSPSSVSRKIVDIASHHPGYQGAPTNGGRGDLVVLQEFLDRPDELHALATEIRARLQQKEAGSSAAVDSDVAARGAADAIDVVFPPRDRSGRGGAGRLQDVELKLAVEKHAVDWATSHYVAKGFDVTDVGATESYDLRAVRGGDELHVEVKGSTTTGAAVSLTKNEVTHSAAHPTDLVVVDGITHTRSPSGGIAPAGGRARIWRKWQPEQDSLTVISYQYTVPDDPAESHRVG